MPRINMGEWAPAENIPSSLGNKTGKGSEAEKRSAFLVAKENLGLDMSDLKEVDEVIIKYEIGELLKAGKNPTKADVLTILQERIDFRKNMRDAIERDSRPIEDSLRDIQNSIPDKTVN